ncbi:Cell division and transport-associated protein TolA [Sphingomonas sp. OV641]|uniref:cell envelope biogenesis protein TolA n=1 Tax=Sphingomonas sp. OV641 TaxID=1881068 RepID=UPI0008B971BB|nr:cell envelope biogenesis protein TolA [Sphingomonas sp. OV641]SEJ62206.1 Cell division and transport-associated protein TolA [Sphingomonas sp. OV641]
MERSEKVGLGVAGAGHLILFGLLSVGFLSTPNPEKLKQQPIDVSLVKDVGLEATAPQAVEEPAQSIAPETGEPDDAAPPAPSEPAPAPEPAPVPPQPQPKPAPPEPAPKPAPKPKPAPPKPAPAPKPAEKPKPRPDPAAERAAAQKAAAAKEAAEKKAAAAAKAKAAAEAKAKAAADAKAKAAADAKAKAAAAAKARGSGSDSESKSARPRGGRLGDDFLKGLTSEPSKSRSQTPRAAKIDATALASIVQAIARQIQPCADRQVDPGPGANEIVTTLNLRLNENGTLAATPTMVRQTGVTAQNERYAQRVKDLGIAAFKGCSPLKLPPEYYDTPNGGWNNINFKWKLR